MGVIRLIMDINPLEILRSNKFSIFCGSFEVFRNLTITEIEAAMHLPPFTHVVYSFKAMSSENYNYNEYTDIDFTQEYRIVTNDLDIPIEIDFYEDVHMPVYTDMHGTILPSPISHGVFIHGHFEGENYSSKAVKKADRPILTRWELLDL